ncbi:MAG: heme lyase CcmF/NrfE family subunit [Dehalococcoidia bacterium]|nr:heme lyase CcmF/NrfE family subunit [Dehalococcoidia bacterium]MSQ16592.1 heme lyase CcmF/NrfE family subunit [Dehalococcoidia bacterium]
MAEMGAIALWISLALSSYALLGSVLGQVRHSPPLVESARRATFLLPLVLLVATLSLVGAFISRDFSVAYVARHSSLAMPKIYTWVAFYAGNEGSLLFIAMVLAAMAALALWLAPAKVRDTLPWTTAALMLVLTFFLAVTAVMANPFAQLPLVPPDGDGINPLLTHVGMFFHPPALMTGLVAIAIPTSFAIGSMIGGKTRDEWADAGRVWGLVAWVLLACGLLLGSWWAYTILGWGGFWFWDPVENAALMPWLALTAFIHSIMVQKRRSMFRMWNIVLINVAFGLALYGMFMNRGGPVPSVHSFGASTLGWVFLLFLGVGVVVPFGIFFWRFPLLKSDRNLDSMLSREASFLMNNLLLLSIAFVTLWGTVYPLISRLFKGQEITVARPYYDQVNGPLMLALVFLMGVGPLLPWRRASLRGLRERLLLPVAASVTVLALLAVLGVREGYALLGFGLCALVAASILQECWRPTRVRRRATGEGYATAFLRLAWSNRPRYGGYLVHLAVVMMALGVLGGSFFHLQRDVLLAPGQSTELGNYRLLYLSTEEVQYSDRTEYVSTVEVYRNDRLLETLHPWRVSYPAAGMASTRAAIRSTPVEDLYVVPSENQAGGTVVMRILINPLVWWMWVAGPVVVMGTLVALWPQRQAVPSRQPLSVPPAAASINPARPRDVREAG